MARVSDLYPEYEKYDWLSGEGNLRRQYGKKSKCSLARGIFHSFMNMVMDDIVEGDQFKFPGFKAMLYMEEVPKEVHEGLRRTGKMQGFDDAFIRVPYTPTYRFTNPNGSMHKYRVIFDKERYYRMLRYQSEGKKYSGNIGIW